MSQETWILEKLCAIARRMSSPTDRPGKSLMGRSAPEELVGR